MLHYNLARKKYRLPCPQQGKTQLGFYESARLNRKAIAALQMFEQSMTRGTPRHAGSYCSYFKQSLKAVYQNGSLELKA